jgi:hypothetical protein
MKQLDSFFRFFILLFSLLNITLATAQHLYHGASGSPGRADIIMNEVMVTNTTPCSYWSTMGWEGVAGGYCGIQQQSNGTNFIFSIWDPSATNKITKAPYQLPNSNVGRFGGEGTGLHYDDKQLIGWKMNTWVTTVVRFWDYNKHTYGGFWTYDYGTNNWTHHVTMDIPVTNVRTSGYNGFLEDWCDTRQNYRKGLYRNCYQRNSNVAWDALNTATYSGDGAGTPYDAVANAGVENGLLFMEFGGSTKKVVKENEKLTITLPAKPTLTIGQISSATILTKGDSLSVSWITDQTKSPQFSYTIKIINNAGTAVLSTTDTVPHLRNKTLYVKNLPSDTYTVSVSMMDIFDQKSNEIIKTVVINGSTGINDLVFFNTNYFTISPNPCNSSADILFNSNEIKEAIVFVHDVTGRTVINNRVITADEHCLDISSLQNGIYFVEMFDKSKKALQRLKFVKENE